MKTCRNIWDHCPPRESSWYWKKLNSLKGKMVNWYRRGIYRLTGIGIYSVSSSYIDMLGPMTRLREVDLIWSSIMLPRQRVIMWLAYQNKLLTKERMQRLHIPVAGDTDCCLGAMDLIETQQHLFVDCTWIAEIRGAISRWSGIQIPTKSADECIRWIKSRQWRQFHKELAAAICGAFIYYAWKARK